MPIPSSLLSSLRALLGPRGLLEGADTAAYEQDWRGLYHGHTPAVLRPHTTAELAAAVGLCAQAAVPLVPQGGNTSMVGGATPSEAGDELVVSLARLNRLRAVDPVDRTMVIEAGVTLRAARDHAAAAGLMLPLSISAEGSATIGGVLATNAGGNNTVRHGNARDLVLGLEVVLPNGEIWHGLRALRKDNTGYALRHLFVGSEGTLGIITAAVLQLAPRPVQTELALCALPSVQAALGVLTRLQEWNAPAVQAFEYMSATSMDLVLTHIENTALPFAPAAHYALIELAVTHPDPALRDDLESLLAACMQAGTMDNAVLAESQAQQQALWRLREEHSEAQRRAGASIKNDISVPVSKTPEFLSRATARLHEVFPAIRIAPFGHLGDGNIHYNLIQPPGTPPAAFEARAAELMQEVNAIVHVLGGSFSAEHGIGRLKPSLLAAWRTGPELMLMRQIKSAIDPAGLMNPGKLFAAGVINS